MRGALVTMLLLLICPLGATAQVDAGDDFTGTVMGVVDGDTYEVWRSAGDTVTVHLWGVDAPEPGQTYGTAATRAVRGYVDGKSAWIDVQFVDPKGRIVARMEVRGRSLAKLLLRRGLVWHYPLHAPNDTTLQRPEQKARTAGRGLWSQPTPTPPWTWRKRH
ncbi:MAG: thermonuclease family protein [Salinibacter sp.]